MAKEAERIGANTFQFFTRNPRGGRAKEIDPSDVDRFLEYGKGMGLGKVIAHAPYTLNACGADPRVQEFAFRTMKDDLQRMECIPGNLYNFHPGSHVGQGKEIGIARIAGLLNQILWPEMRTTVLLETMAGKGSEIGGCFEELREIIDRIEMTEKIGVCLDTCHVYDGGYDIVDHLDEVIGEFDRVIGLERLRAIHLNDSKNPLASRKDRHEKIGEGRIGLDAMVQLINHPAFEGLLFCLETPNELPGYGEEIRMLRNLRKRTE